MKINLSSMIMTAVLLAAGMTSTFVPSVASAQTAACTATGTTLSDATRNYAASCSARRVDCDPIGNGWQCSSGTIGNTSPIGGIVEPVTPAVPVEPVGPIGGRCAVLGSNLANAKTSYAQSCSLARVDCDSVAGGQFVCGSFNNPTLADVNGGNNDGNNGNDVVNFDPSEHTGSGDIAPLQNDSLFAPGDFVAVQYDSCPDPDDLHAAVAGRMVLNHFNLEHGVDYGVVNGTCGYDRPRSDYIESSPALFNSIYGNNGGGAGTLSTWLNAFDFEAQSADVMARKWIEVLNAGEHVWVLDGGPMDFTTQVIRRMRVLGYTANLNNDITVIQHSHGWNEEMTLDSNVTFLINNVSYLRIDNGNLRNNQTAQLNQNTTGNSAFDRPDSSLIAALRNDVVYGQLWNQAFNLFNPNNRFDGSDTVEMLWMFGVKSNEVADWREFIQEYRGTADDLNNGGDDDDNVVVVPPGQALLKIQAENANVGAGWSVESSLPGAEGSYIVWRGANDFSANVNNPPLGITEYTFVVTQPGDYQFTAQTQARVGNGNAANDADNDGWVRFLSGTAAAGVFDASIWTKFFTSGADEVWRNYSNGEQFNPTRFSAIRRTLGVGTHTIQIGGRSTRYAIDYVGLTRVGNSTGTGDSSGGGGTIIVDPVDPILVDPIDNGNGLGASRNGSVNYYTSSVSMAAARSAFQSQFGTAAVDCDPVNGVFICSSARFNGTPNVGTFLNALPIVEDPVVIDEPVVIEDPVVIDEPTASVFGPSINNGVNYYTGSSITSTRSLFREFFGTAAVDCDPVNGVIVCASERFSGTPDVGNILTVAPEVGSTMVIPGDDTTGVVQLGDGSGFRMVASSDLIPGPNFGDSFSANGSCWINSNLDHGIRDVVVQTPIGPQTVEQVAAAQESIRPAIGSNPQYNDVQCGNGPANNNGDEDIGQCPGLIDNGNAGCGQTGPLWDLDLAYGVAANTTFQAGDLISLHYDSSFDPDDLQAMIAARALFDNLGDMFEGSDFIVLNGTKRVNNAGVIEGSLEFARTLFPDTTQADNGVNSFVTQAVNDTALLWQMTIENNGTVFVAEGGPADFTALVVRRLQELNVYNLKNRIRVIQHSHGANEEYTTAEALAYIKDVVTYIHIEDGNDDNATPDFNAGNTGNDAFLEAARASTYGEQWDKAIEVMVRQNAGEKVDFSDFVAVLEILGIAKEEIPNVEAFATKFF